MTLSGYAMLRCPTYTFLTAQRKNFPFSVSLHGTIAFEDSTVADDQTLGGNVAENDSGRLNLYFFIRSDIGRDLAENQDGCSNDFPLDGCLLADGQVAVDQDLPLDLSLNRRSALEK